MPVTAKLSRRVYETLGDDVANAMVDWFNAVDSTYKDDLRELNELNFARFDAKVGERFAQSEIKFAELDAKFSRRFAEFDAKFSRQLAELDAKFSRQLAELDAKFERRLGELETRLTTRMFAMTAGSMLAQIVALVAIFKFMAGK